MNTCAFGNSGYTHWRDSERNDPRCRAPALTDRLYCEEHLAEAMARVQIVLDPRPRPWGGVVKQSSLEIRR